MIDKRKIVLVGTGFVGMSFAYSLLNQRIDQLNSLHRCILNYTF